MYIYFTSSAAEDVADYLMTIVLQIYCGTLRSDKFLTRSVFDEVAGRRAVAHFLRHDCRRPGFLAAPCSPASSDGNGRRKVRGDCLATGQAFRIGTTCRPSQHLWRVRAIFNTAPRVAAAAAEQNEREWEFCVVGAVGRRSFCAGRSLCPPWFHHPGRPAGALARPGHLALSLYTCPPPRAGHDAALRDNVGSIAFRECDRVGPASGIRRASAELWRRWYGLRFLFLGCGLK